jgi:signal peptidase I
MNSTIGTLLAWLVAALPVPAVTALVVIRRRLLVVTVHGASMTPTYLPGQRVLVRRIRPSQVRRGQVVVFESTIRRPRTTLPGARLWMLKRVVAVGGDPVPIEVRTITDAAAEGRVPHDSLVVFGDSSNSIDSRHWGYLPSHRVRGIAVRVLRQTATGGSA